MPPVAQGEAARRWTVEIGQTSSRWVRRSRPNASLAPLHFRRPYQIARDEIPFVDGARQPASPSRFEPGRGDCVLCTTAPALRQLPASTWGGLLRVAKSCGPPRRTTRSTSPHVWTTAVAAAHLQC